MKTYLHLILIVFALGCSTSKNTHSTSIDTADKQPQTALPNILWIVCEDISPTLPMYGDSTAHTPNLDALASESMIYENAFSVVGVCAPSRSAIITGMYPINLGTTHMRTGKDVFSWGKRKYKKKGQGRDINGKVVPEYSAVIPDFVKCFPEYLQQAGYFCTNNAKTDYQFAAPRSAWNLNDQKAHWRKRPKNKPFFSVFNIGTTHESRLWKNKNLPLTVDPDKVPVPPYLPDTEATRESIARHYSNVELMDAEVGAFIKQIKEDGLYDNTIIFFYSDHGGPLPRQKREIYDSGLHVPFMIKDVNSKTQGRTDRMISFVDLAPTVLSLAGVKIPDYMKGKAFLGNQAAAPRKYIYGSSDRFDEFTDRIRAIRSKRFLYLRNYYPDLPKYKDIGYRKNIPMMPPMLQMHREGKLNPIQESWFQSKTTEELYDTQNDPFNLINLAENPKYQATLSEMRNALFSYLQTQTDLGQIPESQLVSMMWPDFKQPKTLSPILTRKNHQIIATCPTKGASIVYLESNKPLTKIDFEQDWKLYTRPVTPAKDKYYYFIAERIGYKTSDWAFIKNK